MKVLKFGGTSVGSVESLANVKAIVEAVEEPAIVVVSALGGITDRLIATARLAETSTGDNAGAWIESFEAIALRHHDMINRIVMPENRQSVMAEVNGLLDMLKRIYTGVELLNDLSDRALDRIVSFGERMSTAIVGGTIRGIRRVYSPDFIRTTKRHGRNTLDNEATSQLIAGHLAGADAPGSLILAAGFISADSQGTITNLGRGGSDYTAAILAAEFNASSLEIWTDVDGFLTADPRKIADTAIIPEMTFVEAMELCNFGAKVVYPPTIYPVFHKSIPIYIKNTFNPSAPGTLIADTDPARSQTAEPHITGISSLAGCALLTMQCNAASNSRLHMAKALNALTGNGIDLLLSGVESSRKHHTYFLVRESDVDQAMDELNMAFASEIKSGKITLCPPQLELAAVAAVGENLTARPQLRFELISALAACNIPVLATSEGTARSSIAFVVTKAHETEALAALHRSVHRSTEQPAIH